MAANEKLSADQLAVVGAFALMAAKRGGDPALVINKELSGYRHGFPLGHAAAEDSGLRYAYGRVIANRCASLAYKIGTMKAGAFAPASDDHPFYGLWARPNPIMSGFFFRKLLFSCLAHSGKCFALVFRNTVGLPVMLWPLSPSRVRARFNPQTFIEYEYRMPAANSLVFGADEVLYPRDVNTGNFFDGWGPGNSAAPLSDVDAQLWDYEREMFASGIFNTWMGSIPKEVQISSEDAKELRELMRERAEDKSRRGEPIITNYGIEWKSFSVGNDVAKLGEISEIVERRARQMYGVPKGETGDTDNVQRSNMEGGSLVFNRNAVLPMLTLMDEEIERIWLPMYDKKLVGQFENPVPDDRDFQLRERETMLKYGVLLPNEWREANGMEPLEGGDVPYSAAPAVPPLSAPATGPRLALGKDEDEKKRRATLDRQETYQLWLSAQDAGEKAYVAELRRQFARHRDEILSRIRAQVPKALTRYAEMAQGRDRMRIEFAEPGNLPERLANQDAFSSSYRKALEKRLTALYATTGRQSAKRVGGGFEVDDGRVDEIGRHLQKSTDSVLQTNFEKIRDSLKEGFLAGEGVDELADRVREIYRGIDEGRALTIARTDTLLPANMGAHDGYAQNGVERKEWITTMDGNARESHEALDGKIVPIDADFVVGKNRVHMQAPGDGDDPGEVIN